MFDIPIFTLEDVRIVRKDLSVNIEDFDQYATEAQRNYLSKLLGDKLYSALLANPTDARFVDLIDGIEYLDGGRTVIYRGIKVYLCYVWLYLYSIGSSSTLTPIGAMMFKDDFAEHAESRREGKNNRDHFIKSADGLEEGILRFLDRNKTIYPEFEESFKIKQAQNDNITFRQFGRMFNSSDNIIM